MLNSLCGTLKYLQEKLYISWCIFIITSVNILKCNQQNYIILQSNYNAAKILYLLWLKRSFETLRSYFKVYVYELCHPLIYIFSLTSYQKSVINQTTKPKQNSFFLSLWFSIRRVKAFLRRFLTFERKHKICHVEHSNTSAISLINFDLPWQLLTHIHTLSIYPSIHPSVHPNGY